VTDFIEHQRAVRAARRGKLPADADDSPPASAESWVGRIQRLFREYAEMQETKLAQLTGMSLDELYQTGASERIRSELAGAAIVLRDQLVSDVRTVERLHLNDLKKAEQRIKRAEQQSRTLATKPARRKFSQQDIPCKYRGTTELTRDEKKTFLICLKSTVYPCNHPMFAGAPESPAKYCTVTVPTKNPDVAVCKNCELRPREEEPS